MVHMIHADGFFPQESISYYVNTVKNLNFQETDYGYEIPNFNMIFPKSEPLLGYVLGERVIIDHKRSGVFRIPINNVIHFESFESLNEWNFIIALEQTTLNLWYHLKESGMGEAGEPDAWSALEGWKFNYRNLMDWNIHTNIILRPNQGVFIRPWVFRSLQNGLVQYYRLLSDKKFRILVMGLPGSSRKQIAKDLASKLQNSYLLDSMQVRKDCKDIDYTHDGRMRQTYRMLTMARDRREDYVILDTVCPLADQREILCSDVVVWANDAPPSHEINFQEPKFYDVRCEKYTPEVLEEILRKINSKNI